MNFTIFDVVQQSASAPLSIGPNSLYHALEQVKDGRKRRGKRYPLALIFTLLLLGELAGETTMQGVVKWVVLLCCGLLDTRCQEGVLVLAKRWSWPSHIPHIHENLEERMISEKGLALALEQVEQEHRLNGAVLVAQDGNVIFEKAYGFANKQLNVPNVLETKFHIASVTKMFIATAALILSEQGQISLQEQPCRYLPELAALDQNITLHHLLSHTAGLQDIYDVPNLRFEMQKLKNEQGDFFSYLVQLPQLFQAGEGWRYSSTGFILMGYLLEKVTGFSFDKLMKRYVLTPLCMKNTGLDLPRRINPGRASGHTVENGQVVHADNDRLSIFEEAPGELYSTVRDLKKWCDAMYECPLVSPQTLQLMFTPYGQVDSSWGSSLQYGYGWFLAPGFRMHGGRTQGFCSLIRQYPAQKVSIIVLFNADHLDARPIISAVEPLLLS